MTEALKSGAVSKQTGKAESLKTFIEQTKLLVTLASGFVLAPPAVLSFLRRPDGKTPSFVPWQSFFWAEGLLVASILAGYVVLGTIAGSQSNEVYDVYRPATRVSSLIQLLLYVAGIIVFLFMTRATL
jgi:hypothetical protein